MNIIAITACPTGVAHTYLAESNLKKAARKLGLSLRVEKKGGLRGRLNLLSKLNRLRRHPVQPVR